MAALIFISCGFSNRRKEVRSLIKVYDYNVSTSNPVAILNNAFGIGYEKRLNELWTAQFSLPADDAKNTECLAFRFVEIFDGAERVDLFRILPSKFVKNADRKTRTYQCEHVLSTLLDDIMFQYHQTTGLTPTANINFILGHQSVERWQIGAVGFTGVYDYKWENENLLSGLFSLPKAYSGEHQWTWDTTTTPWTLNLVVPSATPTARILSKKNLIGITEDDDPSYLITRLYPLGYGEGVNQLTIESVNSGVTYIDASTIAIYGVIAATYIDKAEESAATLKAKAQAYLETVKIPRKTYEVDGADIYSITGDELDRIRDTGIMVAVYDEDIVDFMARIVSVSKSDLTGNPGSIKVQISNKLMDSADMTTSIQSKQFINDVYAQGATNLDSHDFADNCDPTSPAVIKFYIPTETVRINKMLLSFETGAFRAYSKAIQGGGAIVQTSDIGLWTLIPSSPLIPDFMDLAGSHDHNGGVPSDGTHAHWMLSVTHDHDLTLPVHIHDIDYGIYTGPTPTAVIVNVDGNVISGLGTSETDVDIVPYLAKDGEGKITRGTWHEITISPNDLGRIVANVVVQLFVQSRGGGNY